MKKICLFSIIPALLFLSAASFAAKTTFSDGGGILYTEPLKSVIFKHEYHVDSKKISCDKCHSGLFGMAALKVQEKKDFNMDSLYKGKYCGACHNGKNAFAAETQCARCHVRIEESQVGHVKGKTSPYKMPVYESMVSIGEGENKVLFDHKKHSPPDNCFTCHPNLFSLKKGANYIKLSDHNRSGYCFGCHDGKKSFSWSNCNNCHKSWQTISQAWFSKDKADKSSCLKCHTDDAALKKLVKPPVIHAEGGG